MRRAQRLWQSIKLQTSSRHKSSFQFPTLTEGLYARTLMVVAEMLKETDRLSPWKPTTSAARSAVAS